jgi:hypothetical protein
VNRGPVYLTGTGENVETRRSASPVIPAKSGNPVLQYGTTKIMIKEIAIKARK